jgi:acyl-CoA thioester hydrolase
MSAPELFPLVSLSGQVLPDWIDQNEHMNVTRYDVVFDAAEGVFYARFGMDRNYPATRRRGVFRLEKHIRYEREMRLGAKFEITSHLLWTDLKRMQVFHQLWNIDENYRAATMECMAIHMDLDSRKPLRIDDAEIRAGFEATATAHAELATPDGVGRWVSRSPVPPKR